MKVTREILAGKILELLNRRITTSALAEWAEEVMIEGDYEDDYFEEISDALAHIGVMNVEGFELPVVKLLNILDSLNYYTIFGLEPKTNTQEHISYG